MRKVFTIPVYWEVGTTVFIRADSLESALEFARGDMPLPNDAEFVGGSFDAPEETAEETPASMLKDLDSADILES